jgi:group I intron endonuclease
MATGTRVMASGIYVIQNIKNGKVYIGSAKNIRLRWNEHRYDLNANQHGNRHLQSAWNKYGAEAFRFKKLEYCTVDQLIKREQHYLDTHMPTGICYNTAKNAVSPMLGRSHSEETKRKISAAHQGKQGTPHTEEARHKISVGHKGKAFSEEHRRKMSEAGKRAWILRKQLTTN